MGSSALRSNSSGVAFRGHDVCVTPLYGHRALRVTLHPYDGGHLCVARSATYADSCVPLLSPSPRVRTDRFASPVAQADGGALLGLPQMELRDGVGTEKHTSLVGLSKILESSSTNPAFIHMLRRPSVGSVLQVDRSFAQISVEGFFPGSIDVKRT
eukprot:126640-Pyramimonas_sp.AAC.1